MIEVLEQVVTQCGDLVLSLRGQKMEARDKDEQLGQHFSTRADRQSQELGLSILTDGCPGVAVIAEETEGEHKIPEDCIVFDPLDGTTNYFNGSDDFGVTVCMLRDWVPLCGATYFPVARVLVSAVRGKGCYVGGFRSGRRVRAIHWHGRLDKTQLGTDVGSWTITQGTFDLILRPLAERFNLLSSMAAVEGGRRVLFGQCGGYYNFGIAKIWDAAAMALAVTEAGGVVCDPWGNPLSWRSVSCDWVFAANQTLADVVLDHSRNWRGRK